ncbi:Bacteriophage holin family protein [Tenacibaculum sp. MAR_2009_124]|uniref:phage holin family protein n=1 Tax=Tenacibaculum sp. MAR_2009_124 TaxID=1250059 RepID=UPI0008996646|nr:phage holin family protein [Tenacibaculum sp. MAR_2009_124]SED10768.1 Bacteriophage holin family protein [Tenacibaculum sp. MAR_2009_124]
MKNIEIDLSLKGIVQAISYLFIGFYTWLNSVGINAYAFHVLVFFMVLDMCFGAWKANRVPELSNPSSREAKKGIVSKIIMFSIPVVVGFMWGLFDKANALKVVNTSLMALAVAEGYSVVANAGSVYSRKNLVEYDAVTFVFKTTSRIIKNILEKILNNLKNE